MRPAHRTNRSGSLTQRVDVRDRRETWLVGRLAHAYQGFGGAPAYDRLLVLQCGGGDRLGRLALHARHVSDSGADVGVGILDEGAEERRARGCAVTLHLVDGACPIQAGCRGVARELFEFTTEVRAPGVYCGLDLLDRRPTPAREWLRLTHDGENASHVWRWRDRARVAEAPESAGRAPPAGREIHHSVGADFDVGDVERLAMDELGAIGARRVGRAARRQRCIEQPPARPVGLEDVVEELPGVGVARVELDADW